MSGEFRVGAYIGHGEKRSFYKIISLAPRAVTIKDEDGHKSVTNDAERVCRELDAAFPGRRIYYVDTQGDLGELAHKDGKFIEYLFLPGKGRA